MRAVLLGDLVGSYAGIIRELLATEWQLETVADSASRERLAEALGAADATLVVQWGDAMPPAPRLRLLQVAAAGYDAVALDAVPATAAVCNAYGHEPAIGEYAVMTMLAWCHRLLPTEAGFRAGSWANGFVYGPVHGELAGRRVLVIGAGRIGRAIGERAAALGCEVVAVNRTMREPPRGFRALHSLAELDRLLPAADFVIVACALDASTAGLIDARRLGLMKGDAVLLNVARGAIVDEDALYRALAGRRIGGAILDTWWVYPSADDPAPRPSRHPFHELDNVIMTPHGSGWTDGLFRRRSAQMAENLDRLARGEPPINVVRPALAADRGGE